MGVVAMRWPLLIVFAVAGISAVSTQAQEKKPATAVPKAADSAKAAAPAGDPNRPAAAEYLRVLEEWKAVLKELRALKVKYQAATGDDQKKVEADWAEQIAKGKQLVVALESAGIKAYNEAPNEDPQLARFLVKLADDAIQHDDYESAQRISAALIAGQCAEKQIYDSAAISAFVLNDYDNAEKYFKLAKDSGVLSTYGKELEPSVKTHKELWAKEHAIREAEAKA